MNLNLNIILSGKFIKSDHAMVIVNLGSENMT